MIDFIPFFSSAKQRMVQRVEVLEKERQDLLNENIKITEESHKLVGIKILI